MIKQVLRHFLLQPYKIQILNINIILKKKAQLLTRKSASRCVDPAVLGCVVIKNGRRLT